MIARGSQIMKGVLHNPDATKNAVNRYGFFDTGGLDRINHTTGGFILTGRCKDTIVLTNRDNIEPQPIKDAILDDCALVEQIMLSGYDGENLTTIVVLIPNELVNKELLDKKTNQRLQMQSEKVNDPRCSEEDCEAGFRTLNKLLCHFEKIKLLLIN